MAPVHRDLDHQFFKRWSHEMAYVLGYFAADGTMVLNKRGAHFVEFHSTDKCLIELVRRALHSNHRVGVRNQSSKNPAWKTAYRLQLGSKELFADLGELGFVQNKSLVLMFPLVPRLYVADFVRGYFDGDGNVYFKRHRIKTRKNKKWIFSSRFTSGSAAFLRDLHATLKKHGIRGGFLVRKGATNSYELVLSHRDSLALYQLMYNTAPDTGFCLPRKYKLFSKAIRTLYPNMRV